MTANLQKVLIEKIAHLFSDQLPKKTKKMFSKILIANRGEIAIRVMRTCREMGITTVAVFSEADRTAQHVRYADEAYFLGPSPATESYLVFEKVIKAAKDSGSQAIHPGYGFLAENPEFAAEVKHAGLEFIGPLPETIRLLGDKMLARQTIEKAGIPIVPGLQKSIASLPELKQHAQKIGFPLLLKAAAGGGGKGMRVVTAEHDLASLYKMAQSEAVSAFGDDRIYIEKYLENPRHIEIQILADRHGNVIHLGERECSIQRRHQKVIEESPSPAIDAAMRKKFGETAVKAAAAANYVNAGTVEFLLDKNNNFYFLEVNTRLQVEHPVTEMITGIDLVREQILVAAGHKLSYQQDQVQFRGHAIECRIYAEDPDSGFLPSIGTINNCHEPNGPGIRVDSGFVRGDSVSIYYDPLIAKLVVWAENRQRAIDRMNRALDEYMITGIQTVIPFHKQVMAHPDYISGSISTHFIQDKIQIKTPVHSISDDDLQSLAVLSCAVDFLFKNKSKKLRKEPTGKNWKDYHRQKRLSNS